jgi:hypothetical protein
MKVQCVRWFCQSLQGSQHDWRTDYCLYKTERRKKERKTYYRFPRLRRRVMISVSLTDLFPIANDPCQVLRKDGKRSAFGCVPDCGNASRGSA